MVFLIEIILSLKKKNNFIKYSWWSCFGEF